MILICYTCKKDFKCNNGSLQKNCSMKCYYKYRKTDEFKENHRKGIENRKELGYTNCKKCNIVFKKKNINSKFCSRDCQIYFQKYDPETNKKFKEYCSKGGLSSMKVQNRRSSNEIMFFEKCVKYFGEENVESNERIFDGDDADIIIHSIKYAIEWNGEWHYNKDLNRHAGSKLEKDCTKVANFAKCGYTPYVIKDRSCASKNRVDLEFKKFLKTIETKSKEDIERETIIHCLIESIMFNVVNQNTSQNPKKVKNKSKKVSNKVCSKCSGPIAPKNRSGVCNDCIRKEQRKDRPSYIQLKKELSESNYVKVGQKYKVSDNAIRKWMKRYEEMENAN